tara:strand:+ start:801 stop:1031 length:231 start_codon:yes stop_codon:yes gene_type:complete
VRENFFKNGQGYSHNEPSYSTVANWFVRPLDKGVVEPPPSVEEEWKRSEEEGMEFPTVQWWAPEDSARHYLKGGDM